MLVRDLPTPDLQTLPVLMRPTMTSATPSSTQRKNQFHAVVGKTTDHVGMRSARPSTRRFFGHRRVKALTQLPLPCLLDLKKAKEALVRGSQCHRLCALQPTGMECHKQSDWQDQTFLSSLSHFCQINCFAAG